MFGVRPVLAVFLADDAMVGIAFGDQAANGRLGLFVGLGHGVEALGAALVLMADVGAEEGQGDARGCVRQFHGKGFELGHARLLEHDRSGRNRKGPG